MEPTKPPVWRSGSRNTARKVNAAVIARQHSTALYVGFGRPGHHIQPVAGERVACIPPLALKPVW